MKKRKELLSLAEKIVEQEKAFINYLEERRRVEGELVKIYNRMRILNKEEPRTMPQMIRARRVRPEVSRRPATSSTNARSSHQRDNAVVGNIRGVSSAVKSTGRVSPTRRNPSVTRTVSPVVRNTRTPQSERTTSVTRRVSPVVRNTPIVTSTRRISPERTTSITRRISPERTGRDTAMRTTSSPRYIRSTRTLRSERN